MNHSFKRSKLALRELIIHTIYYKIIIQTFAYNVLRHHHTRVLPKVVFIILIVYLQPQEQAVDEEMCSLEGRRPKSNPISTAQQRYDIWTSHLKFLDLSLLTQNEWAYSSPLNKHLVHAYGLFPTAWYAPIFSNQCSLIPSLFFSGL